MNYSPEEIADIKSREEKGLEALKELHLTPAAALQKSNIGNDMFVDKVTPYLQDTKYAKNGPISQVEEPVEIKEK